MDADHQQDNKRPPNLTLIRDSAPIYTLVIRFEGGSCWPFEALRLARIHHPSIRDRSIYLRTSVVCLTQTAMSCETSLTSADVV
jgi:hypothetical protein